MSWGSFFQVRYKTCKKHIRLKFSWWMNSSSIWIWYTSQYCPEFSMYLCLFAWHKPLSRPLSWDGELGPLRSGLGRKVSETEFFAAYVCHAISQYDLSVCCPTAHLQESLALRAPNPRKVSKRIFFGVSKSAKIRRRAEYSGFGEYGFKYRAQWVFWPSLSLGERAQWVPLSLYLCAKANLPSFFCRTHRVCPKAQ